MKGSKTFIFNTIIMTLTALVMRSIGMVFQVYLSNRIGAVGIGIFQLILSVQMLATTLAVSGIRLTTMRLVSEELGLGHQKGVLQAVKRCLLYSLTCGLIASILVFTLAEYIGNVWIGDARTILSLKILAVSLPFIALSSVLSGYFMAAQNVVKTTVVQVIEQLIRIGSIVGALFVIPTYDLEYVCAAIVAGGTLAELVSFLLLWALYIYDKRRLSKARAKSGNLTLRMFKIAMPLAISSYIRTSLNTLQQMLVPKGLRKSGASSEAAFENYGIIRGMVFPILLFPSALLTSSAELLVPELTKAQISGSTKRMSYIVNRVLRICIIFSIGIAGSFFFFHKELGGTIYKSLEAASYIMIFAPLIPVMYMDMIVDGMLKGLGQQFHSMIYNIVDSLSSVVLLYLLLPKYAIGAYVIVVYFTECFNFLLSIRRLSKVVKIKLKMLDVAVPIVCIILAMLLTRISLYAFGLLSVTTNVLVWVNIIMSLLIYLALLYNFSYITSEDISWLKGLFSGSK